MKDDSVFGSDESPVVPQTETVSQRRASVASASSEDSTDKLIKSLENHHLGDGVTTLDTALAEAKESVSTPAVTKAKNEYDGMIINKIERKQDDNEPSAHTVDPLKTTVDSLAEKNVSSKAGTYPSPPTKKPVKFRVTSVNSEPVHSRSASSGSQTGTEAALPLAISTASGTYVRKLLLKTTMTAEEATTQRLIKETQQKYDICQSKVAKIEKEIQFLTNLLPPYNVEIDYPTRVKIGRAIEKLQMKQDELDKTKYSLGIQLSRLWRDHEDGDLWVRSVTNQ